MARPILNSGIFNIRDTNSERIEELERKLDDYKYDLIIIQLHALKEIDTKQMKNLIKMRLSPDGENHMLAKEIINNLVRGL